MKKYLFAVVAAILVFSTSAQTFDRNYSDGLVYVSVKIGALKPVMGVNPRHISVSKLPFLNKLSEKYGITEAMRPFAQADDDALLPYILKLKFSNIAQTADLMRDLEALPEVNYSEKVPLMKVDVTPNEGMSTHLTQINAANAWNLYSGFSNIAVAIVDNAVMWTHADLTANTFTNTAEIANNGIDDDNNGYIDDRNGWDCSNWDNNTVPTNTLMSHGTHCAGIAGAVTNNGIGVASIGWGIRIIPVKTEFDNGSTTSITNGYDGIIYAAKVKARVISCSWGGAGFATTEQAVVNYAWNKGCIVMASAGNSNSNVQNYPGAYANVYCIAACDPSNVKSTYSNYGTWVDITAPGNSINSTVPYSGTVAPQYQPLSGTSMATPMVAGLAGLMLSLSPNMTQTNVLNCISSTAVNIYTIAANATLTTGSQMGAGRIEAFQAMNCAATFSAMPPVANFYAFPKVSCPATPIAFTDSSLYQPTSWSWSFQGGTPATSTSSAPLVTWSTPGTYSVVMTCSNSFGNNSKTKLSYITISNASPLPFSEGFQNATFLPTNWTDKNIDNDVIFWQRRTSLGGFGTSTACAMFDNYTYNAANERDEMRSPKFDFTNVTSARLRFDVAYAKYDATFSDSLEVRVTADCGQTWSTIYMRGGSQFTTAVDVSSQFVPTSTQWRRDSINISALTAGQNNVMFAFVNHGHYGQPIYLDNINLVFPTPSLSVAYNPTVCANAAINFTNNSSGAASYTWNSPGATPATGNGTNASISYSNSGVYNVTLTAQNGTTFTNTVRSVTVVAYPNPAAANTSICAGQSSTISAGGASSYVWTSNTGTISTTAVAVVTPTADATYTLTGYNATCSSSVAVNVSVQPLPNLVTNSPSICPTFTAALSVTGANSYSWSTGSFAANINVTPSVSTIYTVTGTINTCSSTKTVAVTVYSNVILSAGVSPTVICPGGSATFTVGGAITYTWNGGFLGNSYSLTANSTSVISVVGDDGFCLGTKQVTLSVIAAPVPSIVCNPSGTICAGKTVTLTASGAGTYTWLPTNSTGTNLVTGVTQSTVITVSGSNIACATTASITIPVQALPQLVLSANSASICSGDTVTVTVSGANTYSWSNGSSASTASLSAYNSTVFSVTGYSNACFSNTTFSLQSFQRPQSVLSTTNINCNALCNGGFSMSTLGNAPFTYSLGSICNASSCNSLCAGAYTVIVTDVNACRETKTFTITQPPALGATITAVNPTCGSCSNGSMSAVVNGGSPGYSYTWSPSAGNGPAAAFLGNGCYTLTIKDTKNCTFQTSKCIENTLGVAELSLGGIKMYPNPNQGVLYIESTERLELTIYSQLGQLVLQSEIVSGTNELLMQEFAKGVYMVSLSNGKDRVYRKLIIE